MNDRVWENEYKNQSKLVTKHDEPQAFFLRFLKFYKKNVNKNLEGLKVYDAGCGTGRNSIHLAQMGADCSGYDISKSAIELARQRASELNLEINFQTRDIGEKNDFTDSYFDLVLDLTSSNSLNIKKRDVFLSEVYRTMKKGSWLFTRTLCLDGDKNAKNLLKKFPGKEVGTYIMPGLGLSEKVFLRDEFVKEYSKYFSIEKIIKESGYTKFSNQSFKRNFILAYMQKK